jgi:ubiquitin carboxyl-terminal hydrolase 25/28
MNSLFQYYFSVKPLRNAILNYEEHAEDDLSEDQLKKKQISKWELERSKRCIPPSDFANQVIAQLRILFQELIRSDLAYIRPKEELIRLTLVDVKQEIEDDARRRRESLATTASHSILDSKVPEFVEIEDVIENVPPVPTSSPTVAAVSDEDVPIMESPLQHSTSENAKFQINTDEADYEFVDHESNDSGGVMSLTTSEQMSVDKENMPPTHTTKPTTAKSPLQESQHINVMETEVNDEDVDMVDISSMPTPPSSPPPLPDRPVQKRRSTWGVMKYGAQQDVTECITNCLSQMHAAFKPDGETPTGDPVDLFKK